MRIANALRRCGDEQAFQLPVRLPRPIGFGMITEVDSKILTNKLIGAGEVVPGSDAAPYGCHGVFYGFEFHFTLTKAPRHR
jgi:hypothetical protein